MRERSGHYPDIERCKRLTEMGFPKTRSSYSKGALLQEYSLGKREGIIYKDDYVCPEVMELLDEMPSCIKIEGQYGHLFIQKGAWMDVKYFKREEGYSIKKCSNTSLPNALADMWIWCVENGYIKN